MKKSLFFILLCGLAFSCNKESGTNNPTVTLPTLSTTVVSSIANTTALSGGNISSDGGGSITVRGVCWSVSPGPLVTGNHTFNGTGAGVYVSNMTGLSPNTIYYVRAYATNSAGTAYGNELSFTTSTTTSLPTVSTDAITTIVANGAIGGGNVLSDGGAAVSVRGVCWSVSANPVVSGSHSTDGSGIGAYTSAITPLIASTTYHVRAYATNSLGRAYGADIVFTTTATSTTDVYVAGIEPIGGGSSANVDVKYWKNGVPTVFTDGMTIAYCNDIFVSGTDVYIVGNRFMGGPITFTWEAVIWKNGVATVLASVPNSSYAVATSVFVSGTDVYVAGYVGPGNASVAKVWKNGVATDLTTATGSNRALSVFVSGTDVYVAGRENSTAPYTVAKYWKNGVGTTLTSPANSGEAEGIFVSGTDVYVSGDETPSGSIPFGKLWKNGVATTLTGGTNGGYAHDVFVLGTDVYVAGIEYNSGSTSTAKYWKNGVVTNLTTGTNGDAKAIMVKGTDVYVAGFDWNGTVHLAQLWKNGVVTTLSNATTGGEAYGIFVK